MKSKYILSFLLALGPFNHPLVSEEAKDLHTINFNEVPAKEFVKFVSKITKKNFIFNHEDLNFTLSFYSGTPSTPKSLMEALVTLLEKKHFRVKDHPNYVLIEKVPLISKEIPSDSLIFDDSIKPSFHIYKLQYQKGVELLPIIKQVSQGKIQSEGFLKGIDSMQWIESTNSLIYTCHSSLFEQIDQLIKSLDTPQKQVFIEVVVLEVDSKEASEFGLEWGGTGQYKDKFGFSIGNFSPDGSIANQLKNSSNNPLSKISQTIGKGFDLGVIGDLIFHKGKTFITLGSLISALENDGNISVVLNQKILTQDNKSSSIFVGDNIPFTGSVVETVGASQQTTSNIEYRDIGVSLKITPLLGEGDIITLDIHEEITEAREDLRHLESRSHGIQTTKTNMSTRVHVPDQHFLVLSGMVKNSKLQKKTGIPCLGSIPLIGALFSKEKTMQEKRNILVFVRPQIIHTFDHYQTLTQKEKKKFDDNNKNSNTLSE